MHEYNSRNIVGAYRANRSGHVRFWGVALAAAILCVGGALFVLRYQPGAQTTAADGRKVESLSTATSGAAR
jgi:hypothetical protein